mmetsp:Transcript_13703/g.26530  ORF Transcript_13703/g.26530 Transcript_13703/m.26530 type:complete len:175 (-) Transcript_13703:583-1107(-)|eukprot:CAMPEP_0171524580 /NCGR_PEP_ID=MMETSP0959-20130129/9153_1 /TAXON_ID=87120 /ORGANISM="Aurantiochytrium limacinum, Strain ATCCMYA-1381" /LENGTH=174 /DNA_ID=CAMNT_0012065381 /DNA_START=18 /DNA_END=542 /DNA_ORIENTATION=+
MLVQLKSLRRASFVSTKRPWFRAASTLSRAKVNGPDLAARVENVEIGQKAAAERTFSQSDVLAFANVTGDHNPIHVDPNHGQAGPFFGKTVVHGMLSAGLIPALFAERLPGSIYASQTLSFQDAVFPGDTVRVEIEVEKKKTLRGTCLVQCRTQVSHLDGRIAVTGSARVMLKV